LMFSFLFFSTRDLRAPSADRRETLPYDRKYVQFYNQGPKIWGPWGPKTCKNRRDFGQFQTSTANTSGTNGDIQTQKNL